MPLSPTSRFFGLGRATRKRRKSRIAKAARRSRRVRMEPLEDRRLLTLLGVTPDYPSTFSNSTGIVDYDAASDSFVATGIPQNFTETAFSFPTPIGPPSSFNLQFQVDDSGNFSGNAAGDDFILTGSIDLNFDTIPEYSGTLITGEVLEFGFLDSGTTDFYDLRLAVTGGALAAPYFTGRDIGLTITSENSTFTDNFSVDFGGGTKATFGPIDQETVLPAELGNYVWVDTNYNGIQDDGNTGVNGVTVNLYVDGDGDGVAEPGGDDGAPVDTTVTEDLNGDPLNPGYYLFPDLDPGDYFVVFDPSTLPAGFEFTLQDQGADDVDSDADPVTGVAIVTTLEAGESDLTWDAGIVQTINPAIEIVKYVDKIVTTSTMTTIDFDSLSVGEIVGSQFPGVVINGVNNRTGAQNSAMIFDSSNPTGGDTDLGTPNQAHAGPGIGSGGASNTTALEKVLIISEDLDSTDPDDEAQGGTFTFTFDEAVTINHIDLLDIDSDESGGSVVTLTTSTGIQTFNIPALGNNSYQRIAVDVDDVTSIAVNFVSSGAITELKYTTTTEEKQWFDANEDPVEFNLGEDVEFSYHVINTGDVPLTIDNIVDDNATPLLPGDDFNTIPVESGGFNIGDTNQNGFLDINDGVNPVEEWIFTFTITPDTPGEYCNIATVTGSHSSGQTVMDNDPGKYNIVGTPDIDIEKLTNGVQADDPIDAVEIAPDADVTWTYIVTNTGGTTFAMNEVIVVDDNGTPNDSGDDFTPTFVGPDAGNDGLLSPGEVWEYTFTDTAQTLTTTGATSVFDFSGSGSLTGTSGNIRSFATDGVSVNASAFSRDSGGTWNDAYLGRFSSGLGVTDSSEDGNTGSHRVDNIGRDNYVLFEFSDNIVVDRAFLDSVVGDSDLSVWIGTIPSAFGTHQTLSDALLSGLTLNEVNDTTSSSSRWANFNGGEVSGNVLVLAASTADTTPDDQFKIDKVKFQHVTTGIYGNIATVDADGAWDSDPSHYENPEPQPPGIPNIYIEKSTNGVDADTPAEAVEIAPGSPVTWTYLVTNTGETSFAFADVIVMDDNGTPNDASDDFAPNFIGPDDGNDGLLSPGEDWEYSFSTTAEALTTSGATSTFYFNGNSGLDGSNGNIRSFTVDDVSVNASAFSRDAGGVWNDAFLGIFSGGLGVTDSGEGDGSNGKHRVDNMGRDNFVLFEFSENVIVDQAFLDSVVGDSDLSVWIGTIPGAFGSHQTLSDGLLNGLQLNEVSDTTSSSARWANFNGGEVSGNVLVLAASTVDATPEDQFKIRKVQFQHLAASVYANVGKVDAGDVWDADPSHYKNPEAAPSGKIGDYVWNDTDRDGQQDHDEDGIAGVTVNLLDANGNQIETTITDTSGEYSFSGLEAGDYIVEFVAPTDFVFSPQGQGAAGNDSNANTDGRTDVFHLDPHAVDNTIDAGLYESAVDFMFEAEDFEWMDSPWKVYNSSSASGGQFIKAPNRSGSHYNSPPSHKKVMYQFNVDHSGNYEVSGLVRAASSRDNSVWIKVDDNPWVQWHMDVTGSAFQWQNVTDGWDQDATAFQLAAGSHSMQLKVREDGTKLDKFMFSKLSTTTVVIDATAFNDTNSAWQVEVDDDGNEFLIAANGTHYSAPPAGSELTYDFSVDQAGQYQMHALVSALDGRSNSFWVAIDDGEWVEWHVVVTGDQWQWQTVSDGSGHADVSFDLAAGSHTLKIKVREDGAKLDKIVITNDADVDLSLL